MNNVFFTSDEEWEKIQKSGGFDYIVIGKGEYIKWQAGSVPFFGGRSSVWSGWCPRPTKEEMINWPSELIKNANRYYSSAEKLMKELFTLPRHEGMDINDIERVISAVKEFKSK